MKTDWNIGKIFIIFALLCNIVFAAENTETENYLTGMTVTRAFAGNYQVLLKLKNEPEQQYKLKELGNSSFALVMPRVKLGIDEHDIFYENEHPDIKIVLSENRDLTDRNKFYSKINFKTKNNALIHIETYAPKTSKAKVILEELEPVSETTIPDWIWFVPVGILSAICLFLIAKNDDDSDDNGKGLSKNKKSSKQENSSNNEKSNNKNTAKNNNKKNSTQQERDEADSIVDELVKFVIPENELVLMPGVPELPGLENNTISKGILKDVKVDLYDAQNDTDGIKKLVIPEKMSLAERLKNKDLLKEADDIIFAEKETFFENISPINDIPETAAEEEENEEEKPKSPEQEIYDEIYEPEPQIMPQQDEYDKLMAAFKQTLFVAHKLEDFETLEPEVKDAFGVSDKVGFSLVKMGDKISLVGNIEDKIFVIKTFEENELNDEPLFMEFCTQTPYSATYSVILNKFKALVKVSEKDISLIGEYN